MNILITGAKGFIGKNLVAELKNRGYDNLMEYDIGVSDELLERYTEKCDFVFHLAGVNRPKEESEFMEGNFGFTSRLLEHLKCHANKSPVLITSSIQADLNNPYGISKRAGEDLMKQYSVDTGAVTYTFRLPNVFGKWCRPNYNSVVATFCHNIAHNKEITIHDASVSLNLVYIDDVVNEFISVMAKKKSEMDFYSIPVTYDITLGKLAELLYSFQESRKSLQVPDMENGLTRKLYSTYLSYLPEDNFSYPLKMNEDTRGSFTEFIRTSDRGQVSVNISKPGITKGNHWHHTKNEKFLVVKGTGLIQFRKIEDDKILEYHVSGDKLEVVDIPPGYTHNIINEGDTDLVTIMWVNESFDEAHPDTYYLTV